MSTCPNPRHFRQSLKITDKIKKIHLNSTKKNEMKHWKEIEGNIFGIAFDQKEGGINISGGIHVDQTDICEFIKNFGVLF